MYRASPRGALHGEQQPPNDDLLRNAVALLRVVTSGPVRISVVPEELAVGLDVSGDDPKDVHVPARILDPHEFHVLGAGQLVLVELRPVGAKRVVHVPARGLMECIEV